MNILTTTEGFIALVLGFGFIIFVHELGHFLVAKAVGIKVTQFALGMGHAILAWRKGIGMQVGTTEPQLDRRVREYLSKHEGLEFGPEDPPPSESQIRSAMEAMELGETEYRLNWMPIGGYVKMMGQDDMDPTAISSDPRSFSAKPVWARACVISAGVIMNLIFAMVFFVVAFTYGVQFPRNIVGPVQPDSPAAKAYAQGHEGESHYRGIRTGDRVVRIDDEQIDDFMEITLATALAKKGSSLTFVVERADEAQPLSYEITPRVSQVSDLLSVGIEVPLAAKLKVPQDAQGKALIESMDVCKAGVRPGMEVAAIEGRPTNSFADYQKTIADAKGLPIDVTFTDPKTEARVTVPMRAQPTLCIDNEGRQNLMGLMPPTIVDHVAVGEQSAPSPAKQAGMMDGDILIQVGEVAWPTPREVREQVHLAVEARQPVRVTVLRGGETIELPPIEPTRRRTIGIYQGAALKTAMIGQTIAGSPAAALNLNPGTVIITLNGAPITDWLDMQLKLQMDTATADKEAKIAVGYHLNIADLPESQATIALDETHIKQLAQARWQQPIPPDMFLIDKELMRAENLSQAVSIGFEKTHQMMLQTYLTLARLFQGTVKVTHLKGPVGIAHVGTKVAQQGWTYLLFFLGLISVNLVVINFLPMPIVDGGLMVFLIIEKIKGSPVSPRVLSAANLIGLVMIVGLILTVTYFDVRNLLFA